MKTYPMKLVTVITESLASQPLTHVLDEVGAHGYTVTPVAGRGAQGDRPGDIEEFGNIELQVILPPEAADRLLDRLAREFFPRFAMVAYESDVRVLRPQKF